MEFDRFVSILTHAQVEETVRINHNPEGEKMLQELRELRESSQNSPSTTSAISQHHQNLAQPMAVATEPTTTHEKNEGQDEEIELALLRGEMMGSRVNPKAAPVPAPAPPILQSLMGLSTSNAGAVAKAKAPAKPRAKAKSKVKASAKPKNATAKSKASAASRH